MIAQMCECVLLSQVSELKEDNIHNYQDILAETFSGIVSGCTALNSRHNISTGAVHHDRRVRGKWPPRERVPVLHTHPSLPTLHYTVISLYLM